ncbi:MAG: hypothetical protein ACW96U_06135 [Candidatus Heimdallarchaeaceae archaeon]|jgi:hypothetical protein
MPGLVSLFLCFLLSIVSIFGTRMGLFGVIIFIPFLLIVQGYLIISLTRYEIESKLKKIVIYIAVSIALTIIIAFIVSKLQNVVDYDIIILVISLITIIMEIILGIQLILKKGITEELKQAKSTVINTTKKLVSIVNKSSLSKGLIVVLVLTGLCFPLFIRRDAEVYYSFGFTENPPKTAYSSNVIFEISIGSLAEFNSSITVRILINETLFLEDEIFTGTNGEKTVQFQTVFAENGQYVVTFEFYEQIESQLNQIGQLLHWVRIIA